MMKPKLLPIISLLLLFSLFISACSSTVYSSTGWYGLAASTDTAYLAAGTQVHAVDLNTHAEKWHYPDKANAKITFFANPVLTSDGQLLVASYDHNLYSLNPATNGTLNWSFSGSKNRLIASPLVIKNIAYQPSSDGNVYAVDLTTHNAAWNQPGQTSGPIWATPATDDSCGCIYVASMDHSVYKFDASSGKLIVKSGDLGGAIVGTPAVGSDGTLYVGTFGKELLALDSTKLSIKWRFTTHDWVWAGPALANNVLYFGDLAGNFYALNATDGTTSFSVLQVNSPIVDTPVVLGDKIYFTAESDTIFIADTKGSITSKVVGGTIYSAPIVAGDTILVAPSSFTSQLAALSLDGTQKWVFPPPKQ
jgi:outer membrane protein assembly factor BamB